MKRIILNNRLQLILAFLGAIGGFSYWKFIGCNNGTCAIKSIWYWSTLWGTAVGFLAGDFLDGIINRKNKGVDKK